MRVPLRHPFSFPIKAMTSVHGVFDQRGDVAAVQKAYLGGTGGTTTRKVIPMANVRPLKEQQPTKAQAALAVLDEAWSYYMPEKRVVALTPDYEDLPLAS
jgi:hypothetical protein